MDNNCRDPLGACIERGKITAAANDGFRVESLERPGVVSRVLGCMIEDEYTVGDRVLFVMFCDGTGKIFCKA